MNWFWLAVIALTAAFTGPWSHEEDRAFNLVVYVGGCITSALMLAGVIR